MALNLHPAVVHFPVALVTLYGLLMTFTPPFLRRRVSWFPIVSFLIIVGAMGSIVSYLTGLIIEPDFSGPAYGALVETHEAWATATLILSLLFAVLHVIVLFHRPAEDATLSAVRSGPRLFLYMLAYRFTHLPLSFLVGLSLLLTITVTGALGGAIAYGKTADPMVELVVRLLGL